MLRGLLRGLLHCASNRSSQPCLFFVLRLLLQLLVLLHLADCTQTLDVGLRTVYPSGAGPLSVGGDVQDHCIVPFSFLESTTSGCLLNASLAQHFVDHGVYTHGRFRERIAHELRAAGGAIPTPEHVHLPAIIRIVQSALITWLVEHTIMKTQASDTRFATTKDDGSDPGGDSNNTLKIFFQLPDSQLRLYPNGPAAISSEPRLEATFRDGFIFDLVPAPHTFQWPSFWAAEVPRVDDSIRAYCINSGRSVLAAGNTAGGFHQMTEALVQVWNFFGSKSVINQQTHGVITTTTTATTIPVAVLLDIIHSLVEGFKQWCTLYVGKHVFNGIWALRQARMDQEVALACRQDGDALVRSFPIRQDLRALPPKVVQGTMLGSALRFQNQDDIPGEVGAGGGEGLAMLYEGEQPKHVAAELCELLGPQTLASAAGTAEFVCGMRATSPHYQTSCCVAHVARALDAYMSCPGNYTGQLFVPCFGATRQHAKPFRPRAYLHVCQSHIDGTATLNNTSSVLTPGTRHLCSRMFVAPHDQQRCEITVLASMSDMLERYIQTNPRYVNRSGAFLVGQGIPLLGAQHTTMLSWQGHDNDLDHDEAGEGQQDMCSRTRYWDIVVSRCQESVSWLVRFVRDLPSCIEARLFLYEKCSGKGERPHVETLKRQLQESSSTTKLSLLEANSLPNIGFETHTYLYHILRLLERENDDTFTFPDHTFFLQGNPFDHIMSVQQHDNFYAYAYALPFLPATKDHASLSDLYVVEPTFPLYCHVHDLLFRSNDKETNTPHTLLSAVEGTRVECSGTLGFYALSSFFASRRAILRRPRSFYRRALDLIVGAHYRTEGHVSELPSLRSQIGYEWSCRAQSSFRNLSFASGKIMSQHFERMWHVIFSPDGAPLFQARRPLVPTAVPAPETGSPYYALENSFEYFRSNDCATKTLPGACESSSDSMLGVMPALPVSGLHNSRLTLVVYAYHDKDVLKKGVPGFATENLKFFVEHGVRSASDYNVAIPNHIFVLVCQGVPAPAFVPRDLIVVLERDNSGFDFEAWYHGVHAALLKMGSLPDMAEEEAFRTLRNAALWIPLVFKHFRYFLFINSSVRGPYLPVWFHNLGVSWTKSFTGGLDAETKLVGTTMNRCGRIGHFQSLPLTCSATHVQSMVFATDQDGLQLLFVGARGHVPLFRDRNQHGYQATIDELEIGMSKLIVDAGYRISAVSMSERAMRPLDQQSESNGGFGLHGDLQFENMYFGTSLNPLETLFWKSNRGYITKDTAFYEKCLNTWSRSRAPPGSDGAS